MEGKRKWEEEEEERGRRKAVQMWRGRERKWGEGRGGRKKMDSRRKGVDGKEGNEEWEEERGRGRGRGSSDGC